MKIAVKIGMAIALTSLVSISILGGIALDKSKIAVEEELEKKLLYVVENVSLQLNESLAQIKLFNISFKQYLYEKNIEQKQDLSHIFENFLKTNKDDNALVSHVGIYDLHTKKINTWNALPSNHYEISSNNLSFKSFMETTFSLGDVALKNRWVTILDEHKKTHHYYVSPLYQHEFLVGAIFHEWDRHSVMAMLRDDKFGNDSYSFILDEKLNYLIHPTLSYRKNLSTLFDGMYESLGNKIQNERIGIVDNVMFQGIKKVLGFTTLNNQWKIVLSLPQKDFYGELNTLINYILLVIIGSILIAFIISIIVSRKISQPISLATQVSWDMIDGKFGVQTKEVKSNDEAGVLLQAINKASSHISILMNELQKNEKVLKKHIVKLEKAEQEKTVLAYQNRISGLPNFNAFRRDFDADLQPLLKKDVSLSIVIFDIHNMYQINDYIGYDGGEKILRYFTSILKDRCGYSNECYHLLMDKFLVVIKGEKSIHTAELFMQSVLDTFNTPVTFDTVVACRVRVHGAAVEGPQFGISQESLMRRLERLLFVVREDKGIQYAVFTELDEARLQEDEKFSDALNEAMNAGQITFHYQPKVSCKGIKKVNGVEALARWQRSDGSFVPPDRFIQFAEKSGMILELGEYLLKQLFIQMQTWQQQGKLSYVVAVNISQHQLSSPDFFDIVMSLLKQYNIDVSTLEFEITESVLMTHFEEGVNILNKFKMAGIKIALDDFGTGYSSFSYMLRLPVETIKLDRSFISQEAFTTKGQEFLRSLITLCQSQNLKVVVEGIELEEELTLFEQFGCDEIQGYFFSKPLPADELEVFVKTFN